MENFTTHNDYLFFLTPSSPLTDRPNPNSLITYFPSKLVSSIINSAPLFAKF